MSFDLPFYRGLFLRRLPVMMALFLICVVSAGLVAFKLPPTYRTSAVLLVEEPQIPEEMVATIRNDPNQQLQVVEQQLLTRANLLDIAREFDVFKDISTMNADEIFSSMQAQTTVQRSGGRNAATLMTISFRGRSPRVVADVVNQYVTLVLVENTENRLSQAENTLSFFEQETQRLSSDLDAQSVRLVEFKNKNAAALPDDLTFRQGRQALLQERQARLERDIASAERQRREMVAIFEVTGQVTETEERALTREERQLADLRLQLEQALGIYSETNPRVTLLRNQIAQLEKRVSEVRVIDESEGSQDAVPTSMLDLTLAEIDQRTENMQLELEAVSEELVQLEASIAATAANAIALNSLERDYEITQTQYNEAVRNLNSARMSERIEVSAQGQRITIVESASVPQQPSGPSRLKIIAAGIAAGSALAVGFFLLLELLNRTIRRPVELENRFGITTLAVVPYMESRRERLLRRTALVVGSIIVLISVPAALYYIDSNYMPLQLIIARLVDTLGLT